MMSADFPVCEAGGNVRWCLQPMGSKMTTQRVTYDIWPSKERKFWKRWEYQTTWAASWEICMQVRKQQLELDMKQQTGSK